MSNFGRITTIVGALTVATAAGFAAPAAAQATRTWVSGVGDDANPCSRTAPCKTFAGAISKTAAGGEIDVLDPGGFGAVTITKSITIDGSGGSIGGVLVAGTNGFVINDSGAGTANVTLRNFDLEGIGFSGASSGIRGVWFISGASLVVENVTIRNFRDSTNGTGIAFTPSGNATLLVQNATITGNGNTAAGGGIVIRPTGTGSARAVLNNVHLFNNSNVALGVDATGNTGAGIVVNVNGGEFVGSTGGMITKAPAGSTTVALTVNGALIANNSAFGIRANGATTARMSASTITGNGTGIMGIVNSYGDNLLNGNTADGAFTAAAPPLVKQ